MKHALEVSGRYIVKLTRYRDIYVPLRDRFAKAEQAGADLFISLHADLIRKRLIRGASVYTLSEKASDSEAEALAAKENKSDIIAGVDLTEQSDTVASVLISLRQRHTMDQSAHFARFMVESLGKESSFASQYAPICRLCCAEVAGYPIRFGRTRVSFEPRRREIVTDKSLSKTGF